MTDWESGDGLAMEGLGSLTIVVVNDPAQHVPASHRSGRYWRERERGLLLEPLVRPSRVVILHVFHQHPAQVALTEQEQVVETFLPHRAYPTFGNGRIAKDKFCISRWVELPKAPLRTKVSAANGADYPGGLEGQTNQEKPHEPRQSPLADPTTDEGANGRLVPLGQSLSGALEREEPSARSENE